jgi:GNAT superfamily N-acetyltransferase
MNSPYRIREVDGADDDIAETLKELHTETFGNTAPQIEPDKGYWWLCYFEGDTPVAFAGLEPSDVYLQTGYLCRSGVLEAHRGKGLQVRLLRARERKARRLGWVLLRTDTTDNPPSSNSLINAGFRLFEPKFPWGPSNTTLYWRKHLQ